MRRSYAKSSNLGTTVVVFHLAVCCVIFWVIRVVDCCLLVAEALESVRRSVQSIVGTVHGIVILRMCSRHGDIQSVQREIVETGTQMDIEDPEPGRKLSIIETSSGGPRSQERNPQDLIWCQRAGRRCRAGIMKRYAVQCDNANALTDTPLAPRAPAILHRLLDHFSTRRQASRRTIKLTVLRVIPTKPHLRPAQSVW